MKMKKRLLSILLSLALVLGLMPGMVMTAYAAPDTTTYRLTFQGPGGDSGTIDTTLPCTLDYNEWLGLVGLWPYDPVPEATVASGDEDCLSLENSNLTVKKAFTGSKSITNIFSYHYSVTITCLEMVNVNNISLDKDIAQTVNVGNNVAFTATVSPNNATDKYVTWSSNSDALKLYADSSCTVALGTTTGVAAGQPIYAKGISLGGATVTATSRSNNDVTASCDVTVISNTYNVTYKVVNGTWSDGSTADKTETVASGGNPTSVPAGMKANSGYTGGSWDTDPSTATISADTTFTYTFVADSSSGGSSDSGSGSSSSGSSDNTNTNTDTSAKVPYNDVPISTGYVNDITGTAAATAESNPFGTKIENNNKLTTLLSLTDAEVAQGVNVWLDIQDMSSSVSKTDKSLIQDKTGDYTVGLYLDINLFKKVGSNDATKVTETNGKVKASIVIPESLWKSRRTFEIIRVHNGVATAIAGTYDENTHVFTFETDKFSTYALAYKDSASSSNSGTTSNSSSSNSSNSTQSTAPKTGDPNDVRVWYLLLIASLGGLGFLGYSKKKK